jgi:hypothetical protein
MCNVSLEREVGFVPIGECDQVTANANEERWFIAREPDQRLRAVRRGIAPVIAAAEGWKPDGAIPAAASCPIVTFTKFSPDGRYFRQIAVTVGCPPGSGEPRVLDVRVSVGGWVYFLLADPGCLDLLLARPAVL